VRPVSLPNGHIPLREPPCPGRQVGEGVSPTLDAPPLSNGLKFYVQRKIMVPCIERAFQARDAQTQSVRRESRGCRDSVADRERKIR
jgi:hypothetical protein